MEWDTTTVGATLTAIGGCLFVFGSAASRYHEKRLRIAREGMSRRLERGEEKAAARKWREFGEDPLVDLAVWCLLAEPVGLVLVTLGVMLLLI